MDPNGRKRRKGRPVHGWVNLDKPYALGSTKAVGRVRWLFEAQKAGHAGTLDPLATGVLPIALGDATKTVGFMMDAEKGYSFEVTFGVQTTTGDVEGEVVETSDHRPSEDDILSALPAFIGEIEQVPPRFSAIKIDGRRAYDLARAGEDVEIPSRRVRVDDLRLVAFTGEAASLEVDCGKGTYVRSIARDLARAVGTVGHVTVLRRTRVGPFTLETAVMLDALEGADGADEAGRLSNRLGHLLGPGAAVGHLPRAEISDDQASELGFGRALQVEARDAEDFAVYHAGRLRALGTLTDGTFQPRRVLSGEGLAGG